MTISQDTVTNGRRPVREARQGTGPHVLLVCGRTRAPADFFLEHPAIGRLSVLAEEGLPHDFGPGTIVRHVPDIRDCDQVRRAAVEVAAEAEIDAVMSPFESGVAATGYLRSCFDLPGTGYDTALGFSNKYVMKRRLARAGLPVAPFRPAYTEAQARSAAAELGWPCVVKPALGGGSHGVAALADPIDLERYLAESRFLATTGGPLVLEEFVPMSAEYHCDGVVHDGEVVFLAPSRYFDPLLGRIDAFTGSYQLPPSHEHYAELLLLHRKAVRALGLRDGVTHLELFRTESGFLFSEIACRPGGGGIPRAVQLQHGVDLRDAYVRTSLGLPPVLPPGSGSSADYFTNCDLPIRPGRIVQLTSAGELGRLPGVVEVQMLCQVGDLVAGPLMSSSATGIVYYRAGSEPDVAATLRKIESMHVFRTVSEEIR